MSVDKTLKDRLNLNRPSNVKKSNRTPVSKIVTESIKNPPPKPSESEIFKRELEEIAKRAEMMRILEEEEKFIQKKRDDEKLQEKLVSPFTGRKQVDMKPSLEYAIEEILPKAQIPEKIEYPEPFQDEPALNRELAEFKRKINQHLHQVGFMGSGGGGIGDLKDAGDIDGGTALVDGKFLKFDSSTQKFVGSDASVSNETIQDVVGAMVSSNTESGITVAYQDADGTLDFTVGTLNQDTTGSAATLTTARTIGGVSFDGSANINLPGVNTSGNQDTSGNAATATALATARNIGGVSFDGTGNINLPGVNTSGSQDTSGNAATATALATARNIAGVSFDGTGNITIASTDLSNTSAIALLTATQTMTNKTLTEPKVNTHLDMLARAELRFQDASGGQYFALEAPATISSNLTFTLPASDGSDGHFLKTDGSGTLSFAAASVSSLAADNIDAGDAAVNLTTSSGNITIDAAANNTDIIFKGTDASADITMLTLDGSEAGAAIFNDKIVIKSSHLNQGITQDSTNLFIVLDGTNAASANAGDNIIIEDGGTDGSGTNAGDDILHEDFAYTHTGMQREVLEVRDSGGGLLKSLSGFSAGAI